MMMEDGSAILFTGDSITDAGRARPVGEDCKQGLGTGYAGMKTVCVGTSIAVLLVCTTGLTAQSDTTRKFDPRKDLLSLHYDHAPDKDDGHSAAADRSILESLYDRDWIKRHVVAVSGAYGKNARTFNTQSDAVMDAVWNECGGWLAAHSNREPVVAELTKRWKSVLDADRDIWVKEGGQSDITAATVKRVRQQLPDLDTASRIHVVQHSDWNEKQTTDSDLAYIRENTHYIRIRDANAYLNVQGGNAGFVRMAGAHPVLGPAWRAAFAYYDPKRRLDFSDTGELMHILGLGEIGIDDFGKRFLDNASGVSKDND